MGDATVHDDMIDFFRDAARSPDSLYQRLHAEAPVIKDPKGFWIATRYKEVSEVSLAKTAPWNRDSGGTRMGFLPNDPVGPAKKLMANGLAHGSDERHRRLRVLGSKAFTPRIINQLEGEIKQIVDDLIDAVIDKGRMNLVDDFSYPLPITVISRMLGIADEDRQLLEDTTSAIVNYLDANATEAKRDHANRVAQEFTDMAARYVDARRSEPKDDLLTVLVQAEEAGDRMSRDELISMIFTISAAGHETTANVLSSLVNTLLRDRSLWERLLADPSLVPAAVEEGLRMQPPLRILSGRWSDRDVELNGTTIAAGEPVSVWLGAANRDATVFEDPDTFRLDRKSNRHLAFSTGPHLCIGAGLARLELRIALNGLLERLPSMKLATTEEKWGSLVHFRGLTTLPVEWDITDSH